MIGHKDETEFLKSEADLEIMQEDKPQETGQIVKTIKWYIFDLFFQLNINKFQFGIQYYVIVLIVEALQFMTLVLNDGEYNQLGPYEDTSPWKLDQTQWLIDLCWVFRIDRYFKTASSSFISIVALWAVLMAATFGVGATLSFKIKSKPLRNFLIKIMKIFMTLQTSILFIPIVDSFTFAIRCSLGESHDECLGLSQSAGMAVLYIFLLLFFIIEVALISLMYYDACLVCGGIAAKPHPRFKILRYFIYIVCIFSFYFITVSGKIILVLIIMLLAGAAGMYTTCQYVAYFNIKIGSVRLGTWVTFTSAVFCMLIGEFFKTTDQTNSSVSMLFYFLTPCLVQIMYLAMVRRGKVLLARPVTEIASPYQIEIKIRNALYELENQKNKKRRSVYGDGEEDNDVEEKEREQNVYNDIEETYAQGFKRFPNAEYLYLWSGLFHVHFRSNYIMAMVQAYKGLAIANKIDSQYMLFYFKRMSETYYKNKSQDDAINFVQWEKCSEIAKSNDLNALEIQHKFWCELESKQPKIAKLSKITNEMMAMIKNTKFYYDKLLKINNKDIEVMRMYGGFLQTLSDTYETGQQLINKADTQDGTTGKNLQVSVPGSLNQPLSFFDKENTILHVAGDFETIGEIQDINPKGVEVFGHQSQEIKGRKISNLIPKPWSTNHDEMMKKFHECGTYSIVDKKDLILFFVHKNNWMFEGRLLVKVVPITNTPPFFMVIVKPTNPKYEFILLDERYEVTGLSKNLYVNCNNIKTENLQLRELFENFEDLKESFTNFSEVEATIKLDKIEIRSTFKMEKLQIGPRLGYVMKFDAPELNEDMNDFQNMSPMNRNIDIGDGPKISSVGQAVSSLTSGDVDTKKLPGLPPAKKTESSTSSNAQKTGHAFEDSQEDSYSDESDASYESESGGSDDEELLSIGGREELQKTQEINPADIMLGTADESLVHEEDPWKQASDKDQKRSNKSKEISEVTEIKGDHGEYQSVKSESESVESEENQDPSDPSRDEMRGGDASDSKSMNSSTSFAQFSKQIKALVNYQTGKLKKYVMWFKATLILTIIILIATSVVSFDIISDSISKHDDYAHFVNEVGNLRFYTQSLGYYTRVLSLMDSGIIASTGRDEFISWVNEDSNEMHKINLDIYRNYGVLDSSDAEIYKEEDIVTWFFEGGKIRHDKLNLFDATSNVILQGFLLSQEHAVAATNPVSINNRRMFYLFRNGNGETLSFLNDSAILYVDTASDKLDEERVIAILLIVGSVIILFLCAGLSIIPSIVAIEKSKREVWEIFFEVPAQLTKAMKGKCLNRLQIIGDDKHQNMEDDIDEADILDGDEGDVEIEEKKSSTDLDKTANSSSPFGAGGLKGIMGKANDEPPEKATPFGAGGLTGIMGKQNDEADKAETPGILGNGGLKGILGNFGGPKKDKDTKKESKNRISEKVLPYDKIERRMIIFKLCIFFILSFIYFYMIFYTGFETVGEMIKEEPTQVNWASRRQQLTRGVNHWVMETLFNNQTNIGYKEVVYNGQNVASPFLYAEKLINELEYVENSLIFGNEREGISYTEALSTEHEDLLFTDACDLDKDRSKDDCDLIGDKAMTQGVHSALVLYVSTARNIILKIQSAYEEGGMSISAASDFYDNDEDMRLLRDMDNHYLYDPLKRSSELYSEDYREHVSGLKVWHDVLLALYVIVSIGMFFLVYVPMINKLGNDSRNAWNLCKLIPQEQSEKCKKLTEIIKERRDNFKWR